MKLQTTGRHGSLTTYQITSADKALLNAIKEITTYPAKLENDTIIGYGSKSDIRNIQDAIKTRASQQTQTKITDRYIERLAVAQQQGLPHGKSWIATSYHVDRESLDPSWEGESVCYVYQKQQPVN